MKKRKVKKAPAKEVKPPDTMPNEKQDAKSDFGGLPARDLKRNLGCG